MPGIAKTDESLRVEGEDPLALPNAMTRALAAASRLRYCLSLLEAAEQHALDPRAHVPSGLRAQREACGLGDAALDDIVIASNVTDGSLLIPNAALLHRVVTDAIEELIAFLARSPSTSTSAAGLHERAQALLAQLPRVEGDRVPSDYVSGLSRPREGQDSVHALVTELQHTVDELNATLARETVEGATAYAIWAEDHRFTRVSEFHDFGLAVLAQALKHEVAARIVLLGLRQHQVRMLRYFGVDASRYGLPRAAEST